MMQCEFPTVSPPKNNSSLTSPIWLRGLLQKFGCSVKKFQHTLGAIIIQQFSCMYKNIHENVHSETAQLAFLGASEEL